MTTPPTSIPLRRLIPALWGMSRPLIMLSVWLVYGWGLLLAAAQGPLEGPAALWGLAAITLALISIHYTNEYADADTDALTTRTPFSGGSGVLPAGGVPRRSALIAAWITLLLAGGVALAGASRGALNGANLLILALGTFGGWMYSLPPLRLAWRGWGELDNALLGGLLLPLYGYTTQHAQIPLDVIALGGLFSLLVFNNLLATTWPDRRADAQVGKFTLATRWPAPRLRRLHGAVGVVWLAGGIGLGLAGIIPAALAIGGLLAAPAVLWSVWRYTRHESPFPAVFAMIAFLLLQMAYALAAGVG